MAGYYTVNVLEIIRTEASVRMHIEMFNHDAGRIYDTVGFGLQLLDNGKWKNSLIGREVSFEDFIDEEWCQKYANGFVKSVVKEHISVEPLPTAFVTIFCTDAAWLDHLSTGDEWESYAYDVARQYDRCEPIRYNSNEESFDVDEFDGWMPVPSFLFEQGRYRLPNMVYIPKFTESSYFIKDTIKYQHGDHVELLKLHGKYVKNLKDNVAGIFLWNDISREYKIHSISRSGKAMSSYGAHRTIEEMGLYALRPNFKRQSKHISYASIFRNADPVIKSVEIQGKTIALELTGIYDIDALELNKAKVLKLICNNFVETHGYNGEMDSEFPLSRFLKYFAEKGDNSARGIIPKIADGIILKYTYEYPDEYIQDYDEMDMARLIQYFENEEWPCFKFHIELSDEVFGEQLAHVTQTVMPISLRYFSNIIERWEEPILWKDYQYLIT